MADPIPTGADLILGDQVLTITWSDGTTTHYPADHLRARCPCAECTGHGVAPEPPPRETFAGIKVKSLKTVGQYAFQIGFDDGHNLGLYGFPLLRRIGYAAGTAPPPVPKPPTEFAV